MRQIPATPGQAAGGKVCTQTLSSFCVVTEDQRIEYNPYHSTMKKLSTKMIDAVVSNDVQTVAALLDAGHNIDARNERDETAFSYACANNAFEVAKLLFTRGADINTIDKGKGSPLDWAAQWSSPEFCAWLESVGGKRHDLTGGPK